MADKRITDVDFINSLNSNESFFVNQNNAIKQINKSDIVVDIVNGGTGVTTVTADSYLVGNGTNALVEKTPDEVWSHIKSAGKTVSTGTNAEVFNDYTNNQATGEYSHAEGEKTTASGDYSHAEGCGTTASGNYSHASGFRTTASSIASHAEGFTTAASGYNSHAEGQNTTASSECQHVQGKYNIEDVDQKYAHIVGNGTSSERSNAHTIDWYGNAWFAGDIYVGGTGQSDSDSVVKMTAEQIRQITAPRKDIIWENGIIGPTTSTHEANPFKEVTDNDDGTYSVAFDDKTYITSTGNITGIVCAAKLNPNNCNLSDYSYFIIECVVYAEEKDTVVFDRSYLMNKPCTSAICPISVNEKFYSASIDSHLVWSGYDYAHQYHRIVNLDLENEIIWCRYGFSGVTYNPDDDKYNIPVRVYGIR